VGPLAAAVAAGGTILNTTGILALLGAVFTVVIVSLAVKAALHAHRANYAAVVAIIGILALAAMIWSVASGTEATKLGTDLVHDFLNI
jgi:uncharacterized membrane protein